MITPNVTGEKVNGLFNGRKNGLFPLRLKINLNKNCKEYADEDKVTVFIQSDIKNITFYGKKFSMGPKDIIDGNINFEFSDEDQLKLYDSLKKCNNSTNNCYFNN